MSTTTTTRFWLNTGTVHVTQGARRELSMNCVLEALFRHMAGDWGDLVEEDRMANDEAMCFGGRILSAYVDHHQLKFWIITEADRSSTTILLPEEY